MRREVRGLGVGLGELRRQPFRAPRELGLTLAQLACLAHQIGALGSGADLLQTECLEPVALRREALAMAFELRFKRDGGGAALSDEGLRLAQRQTSLAALRHEDDEPLTGDA